jgi:precorrin-6B methylase 2
MTEYIFSENQTDRELGRLRRIEAALDARSRDVIERAGVTAGWTCLEVGAGGGSVLRYIGERVGKEGHAVGVDKKTTYLKELTDSPYEVVEGDVLDLNRPHAFDLVHARYVLIHNRTATEILRHLGKQLKPGGWLVLEEPDFQSAEWIDEVYAVAGQRVNRAICSMFSNMSLDPGYGKRLPLAVARTGLDICCVEASAHLEPGGAPVAMMMADSADALREKYVSTGEATSRDVDQYTQGARDPNSWANYYCTVRVVARTPRR